MTWYIDFCMFFLPNDPVINNNRLLLFVLLMLQMIFYAIIKVILTKYQGSNAFKQKKNEKTQKKEGQSNKDGEQKSEKDQKEDKDQQSEKDKSEQKSSSDENNSNIIVMGNSGDAWVTKNTTGKKGKVEAFFTELDALDFDKRFLNFFGHHAVAIGLCTINLPYYFITAASLVYVILGVICFFFYAKNYRKTYITLWSIDMFINVALFFAAASNIGMMNFDDVNGLCYGQQDLSAL